VLFSSFLHYQHETHTLPSEAKVYQR
jgi:hypothetical protein